MLANPVEQFDAIDVESSILLLSETMPKAADGFNTILEGVKEYPAQYVSPEDFSCTKGDVGELLQCWFSEYFSSEHINLSDDDKVRATQIVKEIADFLAQNKSLWPFFSDFFREKFGIVVEKAVVADSGTKIANSVVEKIDQKVRQYSCVNRPLDKRQILQFFKACGFEVIADGGKGGHSGIYLDGKKVGSYSGHGGVWIRAIMDELANNDVSLSVLANGYNKIFKSGFVILT